MTAFGNRKKDDFLNSITIASLNDKKDNTARRCKFNFSFLDTSQSAGQKFADWQNTQLLKLLDKLTYYCKESLSYWKKQSIGKGKWHILEVYDNFPYKSDFSHPKHVPHQALWARFRLEKKRRLIGFVIPLEYSDKEQGNSGFRFDCNTFYVVFLDKDHRFYKTKK